MKNLAQQFAILGKKQLAVHEGIVLLREAQADLARSSKLAEVWGTIGVFANITLIPLNVIVNSYDLKGVNGLYQTLVRALYAEFAKSGSRGDGHIMMVLAALKKAIIQELTRQAKTDLIPGVNILIGLAEDAMVAWQTVQMTQAGSSERVALSRAIEQKITLANRQLMQMGIERAEVLGRLQLRARTA